MITGLILAFFSSVSTERASASAYANGATSRYLSESAVQVVMGAISEALVATGVGIAVAIPAVAAFNWAKSVVASRLKAAEALMRAVLAGRGAAAERS